MTEARISGHYSDASFTIFGSLVMLELAIEEYVAEKVFKYLIYLLIITAKSQKLILNFSISIISFNITVQPLWIRSQEILISALYLPKLKSVYKKSISARGLKFKI